MWCRPWDTAVHSGTFMAHLLPILAGIAFLDVVTESDFYPSLLARADRFVAGLRDVFARHDLDVRIQHYGPRFSLLFGIAEPSPIDTGTWQAPTGIDEKRFYGHALRGGCLPPSRLASWHLRRAHD